MELHKLQDLAKIGPQLDNRYRENIMRKFNWKESALNRNDKQQVEVLLNEFIDNFAKY